ncbi:MAG TPA: 23S rRNA (pseudouridine(1915)-N(3))-methyltransferase RlmH [Gemmatimonadaceae bacterium]|nr:23S rRNA (pseudouridine(1915)-N(3))-methyltransferase RlmH [Gemmatimonadaceae bacterium]
MHIVVAVVGKPKNASLATAILEYERRAARYWPLRIHEVREARGGRGSGVQVRDQEGLRLLAGIAPGAQLVACTPGGARMTSEEFSAWLRRERERAGPDVAFVIGGASGLSATVLDRAVMRLALAPWTLPHELARLVLAEQLYRAGTLVRGEPYHK